MNCPLHYEDNTVIDDVEISGDSEKPDVYVWTKTGGYGRSLKKKAQTMNLQAQVQPPSTQECVRGIPKQ